MKGIKAVIFDMDNTILSSRIDFPAIKHSCLELLQCFQVPRANKLTDDLAIAAYIDEAKKYERETGVTTLVTQMYDMIEKYEREGMKKAVLEEGATELLQAYNREKTLIILTNNTTAAAQCALKRTGIDPYINKIFGRDQVKAMKPSAEAVHSVLNAYPSIPNECFLMVGDSWIDGMSAEKAGIPFVQYRGDLERVRRKGISPTGWIQSLQELHHWLEKA